MRDRFIALEDRFYRDVLGFEVIHTSGEGDDVDWVLLKLGGANLMLNARFEAHARPDLALAKPDPVRNQIRCC